MDDPHASMAAALGGLDEVKQLIHCAVATSLMDSLRLRKAGSMSQDAVDEKGLQPVGFPLDFSSCSGELGWPSSAAASVQS